MLNFKESEPGSKGNSCKTLWELPNLNQQQIQGGGGDSVSAVPGGGALYS